MSGASREIVSFVWKFDAASRQFNGKQSEMVKKQPFWPWLASLFWARI
jgi:hypothetical protein